MTEVVVLQQSPSHFPSSSSSSSSSSSAQNDDQSPKAHTTNNSQISEEEEERDQRDQVSVVELLLAAFRRSLIGPCSAIERGNFSSSSSVSSRIMQIGWPSNVRHIAHVTFDRFNGFLGLPVEFEPEVPTRPPSASANVFGVSTDSMQLSFDSRGNSVPTILLMMQRHLYSHGGLEAEGIFRINGENSREEYVRDQLNRGVIPQCVDVHSLAGLIKAWFRELPSGLLDSLSAEQVTECETEEDCVRAVRLLPPTEAALLDWTVNLMADVALMEHFNKMNARNIAMVFAPNMTQMADPLTALMYAVQVMNFLKTLVVKTLRERADSALEISLDPQPDHHHHDSDAENNDATHQTSSQMQNDSVDDTSPTFLSSIENVVLREETLSPPQHGLKTMAQNPGQCGASLSQTIGPKKASFAGADKGKKVRILGRINSRNELAEAWR